jgi:hypothetical protein
MSASGSLKSSISTEPRCQSRQGSIRSTTENKKGIQKVNTEIKTKKRGRVAQLAKRNHRLARAHTSEAIMLWRMQDADTEREDEAPKRHRR